MAKPKTALVIIACRSPIFELSQEAGTSKTIVETIKTVVTMLASAKLKPKPTAETGKIGSSAPSAAVISSEGR